MSRTDIHSKPSSRPGLLGSALALTLIAAACGAAPGGPHTAEVARATPTASPGQSVSPFSPRVAPVEAAAAAADLAPLWNPKTFGGRLIVASHGPNLLPDPGFADLAGQWAVKFFGHVTAQEVEVTSQTISILNLPVQALHIRTDQRCEVTLRHPVPIHSAQETYRLRLWTRIDPADAGDCTFGLLAFGATGDPVTLTAQGGQPAPPDPVFKQDNVFTAIDLGYESWNVIHEFLLPVSPRHAWAEPRDTVGRSLQAPDGLATISPRFVYQAHPGEVVDLWLAAPAVEAVQFTPSPAR